MESPTKPLGTTKGTILVVDDNGAQCYATARVLEHAGYTVIRAYTGAEALVAARGQQFDLLLLDIHLPDKNGFVIAQTLKADSSTQHVPIIFHSASTRSREVAETNAAHLGAFLTIPVEPDKLLSVIRSTLARAGDRIT